MINYLVTTPYAKVSLLDNKILLQEWIATGRLTMEDAKEHARLVKEALPLDRTYVLLLDTRGMKPNSSPKEVKDFLAKSPEVLSYTKALAMLIDSRIIMSIGRFFMKFNQPTYPTRIFNRKKDAIDWLLTYENNDLKHS